MVDNIYDSVTREPWKYDDDFLRELLKRNDIPYKCREAIITELTDRGEVI